MKKIKLREIYLDIDSIKEIKHKRKRLRSGLREDIIASYYIEFNDGNILVINKQEYKYIKKVLGDKE